MGDISNLIPFEHRGETLHECNERIYFDGILLGTVSNRGSRYSWVAVDKDGNEVRRGQGFYRPDDTYDWGVDALINVHEGIEP